MPGFVRCQLFLFAGLVGVSISGCEAVPEAPEDAGKQPPALVDPDGRTPEDVLELEVLLTRAARDDDVDAVRRLLAQGADPDGLSGTKARRYLYAAGRPGKWTGIQEPVTPLIAQFASEWDESINNYRLEIDPDHAAQITRLLLEAGADPDIRGGMGGFALQEAVEAKATESAKLLIEAGADVNLTRAGFTQIDIHYADPATALASAIRSEAYEIIPLLLENDADEWDEGYGMDALKRCAHNYDLRAMKLLLDHMDEDYPADAPMLSKALGELIQEWPGDSSFVKPQDLPRAKADWFDCFRMLVERGATLANTGDRGMVEYNSKKIDQPMFNAWLSNAGRQGLDPPPVRSGVFQDYVIDENLDALKRSLAAGTDPNTLHYAFGNEPEHPLFVAGIWFDDDRDNEITRLLVEAGFDLQLHDMEGRTLLHHAVDESSLVFVRYLIEKGADVNAQDSQGFTPVELVWGDGPVRENIEKSLRGADGKPGPKGTIPAAKVRDEPQYIVSSEPVLENMVGFVVPKVRAGFEQAVALQRYLSDPGLGMLYSAEGFEIERIYRYKLPEGPDAFLVFEKQKDAQGRSRFIFFRGDGAMLPRRPGEEWRMRVEDVVDLDADGSMEMLIDVTLRDNQTKVAALRIVPMKDPHADQVVVLLPHRDEPGAFAWRVGKPHWSNKTRPIEVGPMGKDGGLIWSAWEIQYEQDWLDERLSEGFGLFREPIVFPRQIVMDRKGDTLVAEAAQALAERMYPGRYE